MSKILYILWNKIREELCFSLLVRIPMNFVKSKTYYVLFGEYTLYNNHYFTLYT